MHTPKALDGKMLDRLRDAATELSGRPFAMLPDPQQPTIFGEPVAHVIVDLLATIDRLERETQTVIKGHRILILDPESSHTIYCGPTDTLRGKLKRLAELEKIAIHPDNPNPAALDR